MSRRRRPDTDPTALPATREDAARIITALEAHLSPRLVSVIILRYGLTDGIPKNLEEIGEQLAVSRSTAYRLVGQAFEALRQPEVMEIFRERDAEGLSYGTVDVRWRPAAQQTDEELGIIRCGVCERRFLPYTPRLIRVVPAEIYKGYLYPAVPIYNSSGRPRKYCSNKCRQAAYRARRVERTIDSP